MKKFTVILLWAALALPMMAQTATKSQTAIVDKASIEQVAGRPLAIFDGNVQTAVGIKADAQVVYETSFETDAEIAQWSVADIDGDGYNWEIDDNYGHTGNQSLTSRSYYGGVALSPDNWLISPKVPLGGSVKFWAMNYLSSYPDVFAVYVCEGEPTSVDDFVKISGDEDIAPPTTWQEYEFDLSAYAGKEGCIAIRHYNSIDQFRLFIDDFSVLAPAAALPQNVTVSEVTATTAKVTWNDEENVKWNLRYRPVIEQTAKIWDFEDEAQIADWTFIDSDGDGYNWQYFNYSDGVTPHMTPYEGYGNMSSASFVNNESGTGGTALFPDNWLISPKVDLGSTLSFYAAGQDANYAAEVFAVYVSESEPTIENFVKVGGDYTATGTYQQIVVDLSAYEGKQGYFAIRHYNCTDMFWLNIDNVALGEMLPEPEWQYVYDVEETEKVLEGLTPETTYEVQVQGVDEAKAVSAWTESVLFTTLAEDPIVVEEGFFVIGGFNGWAKDDTKVEITDEGANITVAAQDFSDPENTNQEFKIITADADAEDGWMYFGGEDENPDDNVPMLITDELINAAIEITLDTPGANFRLPAAGTYNIKLVETRDVVEGLKMLVSKVTTTAVNDINTKTVAGIKYVNIAGMESNKPFDGVNIMVTTYTDGTKATAKVIK